MRKLQAKMATPTGELKQALCEYNKNYIRHENMKRLLLVEFGQTRKLLANLAKAKGNHYDPRARTPGIPEAKLDAGTVVKLGKNRQRQAGATIQRKYNVEKELIAAEKNTQFVLKVTESQHKVKTLLDTLEGKQEGEEENDAATTLIEELERKEQARERLRLQKHIEEQTLAKNKILQSLVESEETTKSNIDSGDIIQPSPPTINLEMAIDEAANKAQTWKKNFVPFSKKMLAFARKTHDEGQAAIHKVEVELSRAQKEIQNEKNAAKKLQETVYTHEREIGSLKTVRDRNTQRIKSLQHDLEHASEEKNKMIERLQKENLQIQKELREVQFQALNAQKKLEQEQEKSDALKKEFTGLKNQIHILQERQAKNQVQLKQLEGEVRREKQKLADQQQDFDDERNRLSVTIQGLKKECCDLESDNKRLQTTIEKNTQEHAEECRRLHSDVRAAKRETEKIEEMFDEMSEEKDALSIKCGELERDLEFSRAQMGKLELEQAESTGNVNEMKNEVCRLKKEAGAAKLKVQELTTQLRMADEKVATLTVVPVKHATQCTQTSSADDESILAALKEEINDLQIRLKEAASKYEDMEMQHKMELQAVVTKARTETELYESLLNEEKNTRCLEEAANSNSNGVTQWGDSVAKETSGFVVDSVPSVTLRQTLTKERKHFPDQLVIKVSKGMQTDEEVSTEQLHDNNKSQTKLPKMSRVTEPPLPLPRLQTPPPTATLPLKHSGGTISIGQMIAESRATVIEQTLDAQTNILSGMLRKKVNDARAHFLLSNIVHREDVKTFSVKNAYLVWKTKVQRYKLLAHSPQPSLHPPAVIKDTANSASQTANFPLPGQIFDQRTRTSVPLSSTYYIDEKSKLYKISKTCMQVQRNAAVQEKELLICVAHLIKDIAFCIGNHEKKEISEKFSSVLIENLQHQLKEWLVHIGMRQKDLQGQVKRMKAQLQHDVVHFVLNHDVTTKPISRPKKHEVSPEQSEWIKQMMTASKQTVVQNTPLKPPPSTDAMTAKTKGQTLQHNSCPPSSTKRKYAKSRRLLLGKLETIKKTPAVESPSRTKPRSPILKASSSSSTGNIKKQSDYTPCSDVYSAGGNREVEFCGTSTTEHLGSKTPEIAICLDDAFTLAPGAAPPPVLNEAFEPVRYRSVHAGNIDHINNMKKRAQVSRKSKVKGNSKFWNQPGHATPGHQQINPWTPASPASIADGGLSIMENDPFWITNATTTGNL